MRNRQKVVCFRNNKATVYWPTKGTHIATSNHTIKTVTSITIPLINMGTLVHVELEAGEQCE